MEIKQIENDSKGAFLIEEGSERLGEMTYSKAGDNLIIIDHTEVSDRLRGQGAGKKLVLAAVEYARNWPLLNTPEKIGSRFYRFVRLLKLHSTVLLKFTMYFVHKCP